MRTYTDYTDACPKCMSRDLSRIDYGMNELDIPEYVEKYRCIGCGHVFYDVYRYHHSYDMEGAEQ